MITLYNTMENQQTDKAFNNSKQGNSKNEYMDNETRSNRFK